jgi:Ca2+-binding RTX toxin-like protein
VGQLAATSFRSGAGFTTAADADDFLIYNSTTGKLYYDTDGNGAGAAVQIALIGNHAALTAADFVVI